MTDFHKGQKVHVLSNFGDHTGAVLQHHFFTSQGITQGVIQNSYTSGHYGLLYYVYSETHGFSQAVQSQFLVPVVTEPDEEAFFDD